MASEFACDLTVFTPAQRERLRGLVRQVFDACRDVEELPDGFRLRFPARPEAQTGAADDGALPLTIAEWITLERRCCPCIAFAIEFAPDRGPLAVRMTGAPGIKPFLLSEFGERIAQKRPHAR